MVNSAGYPRTVQEILNRAFDVTNNRLRSDIGSANQTFDDDILFRLGTDGDQVELNRSTTLAASTALASVLLGTTTGSRQALAANSHIISNVTASGDEGHYVNQGGESYEWLLADGSAGIVYAGMSVVGATALVQVEHRDSTNTASHARVNIRVTNTSADPFLTLATAATTYYVGIDNSAAWDPLIIGTGVAVGTNGIINIIGPTTSVLTGGWGMQITTPAHTLNDGATNALPALQIAAYTSTFPNTTPTKTSLTPAVEVRAQTINQSGGAITVNKAAGVSSVSATAGASVTITHSSAFRALTGGAAVNVSAFYAEAQTAGTTGNYQFLMETSTAVPAVLTDHVGMGAVDIGVGDARLWVMSEAGSAIYIGNDRLRFAATTGIIDINGTTVISSTTTVTTLAKDIIASGLAAAGAGTALVLDAQTHIIPLASSAAFKDSIRPLAFDAGRILDLEPRSFRYKSGGPETFGWVAEEVAAVMPEMVNYKDGQPYSVKYTEAAVLLASEVKRLRERVTILEGANAH